MLNISDELRQATLEGAGPAKVRTLIARLCEDNEIYTDANYIYVRDGLYFRRLDKNHFISEFYALYRSLNHFDWRPNYGTQAYETILMRNFRDDIGNYPDVIPFANGLYFLKEKRFRETTEDYIIWNPLPYNYTKTPRVRLFNQTIEEILPNKEDRDWFLTYICYSFTEMIDKQVGLIMIGDGNNGKTKTAEFFISLLGKRSVTTNLKNIKKDPVRCNLRGKTLCYSSEIGGSYIDDDFIEYMKYLVTEMNLSGRKPFGQVEEWINTTKFLMGTNKLPKLQSYEKAFMRRFKIIEFPADFTGKEDRTIFDRILEKEAGDVLSLLLNKYNNFELLAVEWEETMEMWKNISNPVKRFIDEMCISDGKMQTRTDVVYAYYVQWCIDNNITPLSRKYYNGKMTKLGYPPIKVQYGDWIFKVGCVELQNFKEDTYEMEVLVK